MIKVFIVATLLFGLFSVKAQELSWQEYKNKYFKNDSFIVDPYNNNRVTSESQGYGMILAVIYDDKDTFYKLWRWTKLNMLRGDYLFSWLYNNAVVDKNNATDGDLLIAYALRLAYSKWKNEEYLKDYNKIKNSVRRLIVIVLDEKERKNVLLLPGMYGFTNEKYDVQIFPSYYIPFILKEFKDDRLFKLSSDYLLNNIITLSPLTNTVRFNLIEKKLALNSEINMDVYRLIPYFLLSNYDVKILRNSFKTIDEFFKKEGYIPLTFKLNEQNQMKQESPFCVYRWFYILYNDDKYFKKYEELKNVDKNNYFCDSFELFLNSGWKDE